MSSFSDSPQICPECGSTVFRTDADSLPQGTVLAGRYELISTVTAGNASMTYLALDSILGKKVIIRQYFPAEGIKCVQGELVPANGKYSALLSAGCGIFAAKITAAAKIGRTDGSAEYSDIFRSHGTVFIVRTFIEGSSVKELMKSGNCGTVLKLHILRSTAEYVSKLHSSGTAHGGIRPENIIIDSSGNVYVTGIAAPVISGGALRYSRMAGFGAPELTRGSGITHACDIYSLAALGYCLFTGEPPAADHKKLHQNDVPDAIADFISAGLSMQPDQRPITVSALLDAVSDIGGDQMTERDQATVEITSTDFSAPEVTAVKPAVKKHLTAKGIAVIAAAAAVLVIGTVTAGIFAVSRFSDSDTGGTIALPLSDMRIPDLSGMDLNTAKETAEKLGLHVKAADKLPSDDLEENMIMLQQPANGTVCKEGDTVYVTISAGKPVELFSLPDYAGTDRSEAVKDLEAHGINVVTEEDKTALLPKDIVSKQDPPSGNVLKAGDTVTLWISVRSRSFSSDLCNVPNYIGASSESISSLEGSENFSYSFVKEFSNQYAAGIIFAQSVPAGDVIRSGGQIVLTVSMGRETAVVPDTQYKEANEAWHILYDAGFQPDVAYEKNDSVEEGHVIYQLTAAGSSAEKGAVITIVVSEGSEPAVTEAPQPQEETAPAETEETSQEDTTAETVPAETEAEQAQAETQPTEEQKG